MSHHMTVEVKGGEVRAAVAALQDPQARMDVHAHGIQRQMRYQVVFPRL